MDTNANSASSPDKALNALPAEKLVVNTTINSLATNEEISNLNVIT